MQVGRRPEWATATLLLGGEDAPLLDSNLPQLALAVKRVPRRPSDLLGT